MPKPFVLLSILLLFIGCEKQPAASMSKPLRPRSTLKSPPPTPQKTAKTIHVFVALCDNENQGIVPVPPLLGNGNDPRNNLYWGAMYGTKTFLKKSKQWIFIQEIKQPKKPILQRIIFRHATQKVYLVADAYQGAHIKQTLIDFLRSAAGYNPSSLSLNGALLGLNGKADLVVYVGHNGLMDVRIAPIPPIKNRRGNDAMVLACKSKPYFQPRLSRFHSRSVLLTTGFMAPEAYTLSAAVSAWAANKDASAIREAAAQAYHSYQKCGIKGARRLFYAEEKAP